ncbi:hypothetical protein [Tenacibaculum sp. 190524A02b]|uniref:hypothetical protein n=1 Tax=Tenacibaculum vairaonense TaxID=3137860 RepID=UPI0031FB529B
MKFLINSVLFLWSCFVVGQEFYTDVTYADIVNKGIRIQNSYPKGGQKCKAPNGREYVYLVFWTRISNEMEADITIEIEALNHSFVIPSAPNTEFKVYIPTEKMTLEKEKQKDYGLNLALFLDHNLNTSSKLIENIPAKGSLLFYSIVIATQGINGVVRAGFELHEQNLIYNLNNYKVPCGSILVKGKK